MKTLSLWIAVMPLLTGQTAIPAIGAAPPTVYIVSRASTAESKALFSERLLKLNATALQWYEGAAVLRAQVPQTAMDALRADRDVVLVLSETDATLIPSTPPPPQMAIPVAAPPMSLPLNMPPNMPMNLPMNMPMGAGMPGGMGFLDSLAGGFAQRLMNRAPSCKISIAKNEVKFGPEGGEGLISINASGSCAWQAQSSVSWIKILSGSGVSGSGIVSYTVDPAAAKDRAGVIWIASTPAGSPIKGSASQVVTQTR